MLNKNKIGSKLFNLRGERSREEIAFLADISVSALQMYENGNRIPRDETKIALSEIYNVSVQELFFDKKLHNTCSNKKVTN